MDEIYYLVSKFTRESKVVEIPEHLTNFTSTTQSDVQKIKLIEAHIKRQKQRNRRYDTTPGKFIRLLTKEEYIKLGGEIVTPHSPNSTL